MNPTLAVGLAIGLPSMTVATTNNETLSRSIRTLKYSVINDDVI